MLHCSGNTDGNVIGSLAKPAWTDSAKLWQVTSAAKQAIFGEDDLPLPGGRLPVELRQMSSILFGDTMVPNIE